MTTTTALPQHRGKASGGYLPAGVAKSPKNGGQKNGETIPSAEARLLWRKEQASVPSREARLFKLQGLEQELEGRVSELSAKLRGLEDEREHAEAAQLVEGIEALLESRKATSEQISKAQRELGRIRATKKPMAMYE